jgi:hypothetical protein
MMHRPRRSATAFALPIALIAGCSLVGGGAAPGADVPSGYEDVVTSARMSLLQNLDGFVRPTLAFSEIRCYANGGRVVLFREVGGANAGRIDWTMQGAGAVAGVNGWSGGFGEESMLEEIEFSFGTVPLAACPAL